MRGLFIVAGVVAMAGCASSDKVPARTLAVELQVEHPAKCVACADRIAALLKDQDGVVAVHPLKARDSALVYFRDGGADIDAMRRMLATAGYATRISWGPAAVSPAGGFERAPIDTVPRRKPTLKEQKAAPPGASGTPALKSGFTPPEEESVPALSQ